jgi:hypothetical protein
LVPPGALFGAQSRAATAAPQFGWRANLAVLVLTDLDPAEIAGDFIREGAGLTRSLEDAQAPTNAVD